MKVTLLLAVLLLAAVALTSALGSPEEDLAPQPQVAEDQDGADLDGAETFFFNKIFRPRYHGRSYYRPRRYHYRPSYYRSYHGGYW